MRPPEHAPIFDQLLAERAEEDLHRIREHFRTRPGPAPVLESRRGTELREWQEWAGAMWASIVEAHRQDRERVEHAHLVAAAVERAGVLDRIREDQASLEWHDRWRVEAGHQPHLNPDPLP